MRKQDEGTALKSERDFHQLNVFHKYAKFFILGALLVAEIFLLINNWAVPPPGESPFRFPLWYVVLPMSLLFFVENIIKLWVLESFNAKIAFYVVDVITLIVITFFSDGALISTLLVIILTEFYLSQDKLAGSVAMCISSIVVFFLAYTFSYLIQNGTIENFITLASGMVADLILIVIHFLVINFAIFFYRKNVELTKANEQLNASNEKLQTAYHDLQELTALEERQRIAKDIHDTAGHSITTVIMQTEAAKLVIDSDPIDAKRKIAAANLQAKHALEELRESVHLLSGMQAALTLKEILTEIVNETMDGTGVVVRCDIDDISLSEAKQRFLRNTLKEGISNGLRHGKATAFYFELKERGENVEFLLSDNGSGVKPSEFKEGFGLTGMHARAELLGGTIRFETEEDEGFEIHLTLPFGDEEGEKND